MVQSDLRGHSPEWLFFVKVTFFIAFTATAAGVIFMPGALLLKGYFSIGALFLVSSTFTLAKTLRDDFESKRLLNQLNDAKASQIIKEFSEVR